MQVFPRPIYIRASSAPHHPPFFGLHGCMAAGLLSEPPAGSRGHCKVTHRSWLFWPCEVSSSSASKIPLHISCAGWWPGHPQSRLSIWKIKVCFSCLMNGFGKNVLFFLDIAWWYYQYQRGKKKFKLTWLLWLPYFQWESFLIKDVFCQ